MVLLRGVETSKFGLPSRCTKHVLRRRLFETRRLFMQLLQRPLRVISCRPEAGVVALPVRESMRPYFHHAFTGLRHGLPIFWHWIIEANQL